MLALRYRRQWIAANTLLVSAVLVVAILPGILWPGPLVDVPGYDKWLHAFTFTVLALWFTGQYARASYWLIALVLLAYGALIELGQSMIPYRTADWADFAANFAGILSGILIAIVATGGWSQRAEEWLAGKLDR